MGWNVSKSTRPPASAAGDGEVRALLDRYRCPVPFHAVRPRFLGGIASPVMSASPLDAVKALWGGEFPEFDSLDAVNELLRILIMGLWNRLSRHQERNAPFRLMRVDPGDQGGRPRYGQFRRHAAGVRAALDTLEPIPSTTLLSAQEAKDRLREIIEGFFFQRLRTEDGNDAASVAASSTSTR